MNFINQLNIGGLGRSVGGINPVGDVTGLVNDTMGNVQSALNGIPGRNPVFAAWDFVDRGVDSVIRVERSVKRQLQGLLPY